LRSYQDLWCAGGYIIKKDLLRPIVNGIFQPLRNGWTGVSIIAGYDKPCTPAFCCPVKGAGFSLVSPCIRSPRGYQSDHFVFSLLDSKTYMLHVPILTGARTGNISTLHQDHVGLHVEAFRRINQHVDEIRSAKAIAPGFIHDRNCKFVYQPTPKLAARSDVMSLKNHSRVHVNHHHHHHPVVKRNQEHQQGHVAQTPLHGAAHKQRLRLDPPVHQLQDLAQME
jgi:hypothetical protein